MRLVICRSTTSDLIKMAKKIEEFFTQQANSSVMMLSSYSQQPVSGDAVSYLSNPLSQPAAEKIEKDPNKDGKYLLTKTIWENSCVLSVKPLFQSSQKLIRSSLRVLASN